MSTLSIVVCEDDPRYRASLETLFAHTPGLRLAGAFADPRPLLAAAGREATWDVAFLDVDLPGMSGIDAARQLKQLRPELPILMLTVFEEPTTILQAICAGADGYLLKRSSARTIVEHARAAVGGDLPITAPVAARVLELIRRLGADRLGAGAPARIDLSEREREVLRGLCDGKSYKQVADGLGVKLDTVRTHVRNLYKKLRVHSASEAVARALREQLV